MSNSIFSESIAELQTIPRFIEKAGLWVLPLQLHFATIALGALSFLIPIVAIAGARIRAALPTRSIAENDELPERGSARKSRRKNASSKAAGKSGDAGRKSEAQGVGRRGRRPRLADQRVAAAVVRGFHDAELSGDAEQPSVRGRRRHDHRLEFRRMGRLAQRPAVDRDGREGGADSDGIRPRLVALVALILLVFAVGSGQFYAWTGEGRRIGWDEEPLWFPHAASRFAGGPEMPDRFLSYHNGLASVFLYYNSPERPGGSGKTVYTDPRLEVTGPDLYQRYLELQKRINGEQPGWQGDLDAIGRPSIMVDHDMNSQTGSVLLGSDHWRCVWFDELVAVFVHDSYRDAVKAHQVDFGARHFHPDAAFEPHGAPALIAEAKGLRNYVNYHGGNRVDLARPMIWLGLDYARRVVQTAPDSLEGWKSIGLIEMFRDPLAQPAPRYRLPFDPIFDLSPDPRDLRASARGRDRPARLLDTARPPELLPGANAPRTARAGARYDRLADADQHRPGTTASPRRGPAQPRSSRALGAGGDDLAEPRRARPDGRGSTFTRPRGVGRRTSRTRLCAGQAPWETVERLANLYLHLGEPGRARATLTQATAAPRPAVRDARLAVCDLAEGRFAEARRLYQKAIEREPELFEARYGLAVLEQDDGRAGAAYEQALVGGRLRSQRRRAGFRSRHRLGRRPVRAGTECGTGGRGPPLIAIHE